MPQLPRQLDEATLLRIAGRWLHALTDGSREIVALCDREGRIQYMSVSGAVQRVLGYDALELASKAPEDLLHPDDATRVLAAFRGVAAEHGARHTTEYRLRHRGGHFVQVESTAVNRTGDELIGAVVIHTREVSIPEIPVLTGIDPVTHLNDRSAFSEAVAEAIGRVARDPNDGFSVLICEIDRFKMLVGNYGPDAADALLLEMGRRLSNLLRPEDTLAQLERGEFAIMLGGIGDRTRASSFAERVQSTVAQGFEVGGQSISPSIVVGIATSERTYERAEHVIRDAALAVTRARSGGGRSRRAVFQTQMRVEDTRYMSLIAELHLALEAKQFRVHYQPIVSLATRSLVGFEALVRWYHPQHGVVSPAQFIPIAEETGLIVPLGTWVLEESCRQMAEWNAKYSYDPPLHVSVNLSTKQLAEDDVVGTVDRTLSHSGLPPFQLKLELTESAVLENSQAATATLNNLKARGVRMSLDDFGTGYSSFSYLHKLPYDTLKIDRSFVSRIGDAGEGTEIVHAMIVLAHNLRMEVVAEGVETEGQGAQLGNMWCEYAQGYYFAKPLEAEAARALIASRPQW